ncbi:MAG TPA: NAD-dependent deacylase [Bacteroidetes bacterium]|nr:NAD-dependent deacylase [Bacteroidota bacterium]
MDIVVLTGAGMSSESGLKTFRDTDGLWEGFNVDDVASAEGWERDKKMVLDFYNNLRSQLEEAEPNEGHYGLAALEKHFNVEIITQNVDNLHERAGSKKVLHLHGELTKVRSTIDDSLVYDIGYGKISLGDKCGKGSQLRPHIVFFGEPVPNLQKAIEITSKADIFLVIGSSLNVYPAAGLISYAPEEAELFLIDPKNVSIPSGRYVNVISMLASEGVKEFTKIIMNK